MAKNIIIKNWGWLNYVGTGAGPPKYAPDFLSNDKDLSGNQN